MLKKVLLLSIILLAVSCTKKDETQTVQQEQPKTEKATNSTTSQEDNKKLTLMFFMNPHGSPCQMQDKILKGMGATLTDKATIQYVKTTEMESARPLFMKYGIRALPTLILVDNNGNVIKRFTPGPQSEATIEAALN